MAAATRAAAGGCLGAILVGGEARRFGGRPKGLEQVGGRRIVDRVASALVQVSDALVVVAAIGARDAWLPGVPVIHDLVAGGGPLAGLLAAFEHGGGGVLAVAWDMPFLSASLLGELRRIGEAGDADAVMPESDDGRVEPLCAYYAASAREQLDAAFAAGERQMHGAAARLRVTRLPLRRVLDWGDPRRLFFNVNTPASLVEAMRLADPAA